MIETARLILAPPTLSDFDASHALSSDAAVMAFIGKPASREDAWNKLLRNIGHWTAFGYGIFAVRERLTGVFIGEVGIAHFSRGLGMSFDPFPEAAWVLARAGHGKGYATEAVTAAHEWMARTHRPGRTVCIIDPNNHASIGVASKLGYIRFGDARYRESSPIMFERIQAPGPAPT